VVAANGKIQRREFAEALNRRRVIGTRGFLGRPDFA
jgi:hypothetical protein